MSAGIPDRARVIVENSSIVIYQDEKGCYWRLMKLLGNTRFPITVIEVPNGVQPKGDVVESDGKAFRVEDLI